MATIVYQGREVTLQRGETVLEGLLRVGASVPHTCRRGLCKTCVLQATPDSVPSAAQRGLLPSESARGLFLACLCRPVTDLHAFPADDAGSTEAEIVDVTRLSATVVRLRLRPDAPVEHQAGQYLVLEREDGLSRSYSMANRPGEPWLELHIRLMAGGAMSGWAYHDARRGTRVRIRGPYGDCVYAPDDPDAPLLMVGVGTGIAPLWGVVREALASDHRGSMTIVEAGLDRQGLYLHDDLRALAREHGTLHMHSCVLEGDGTDSENILRAPVDKFALQLFARADPATKARYRVLLCGDSAVVHRLRRGLFLAGLSSRRIFADAFVLATAPSRAASATQGLGSATP
ncbi:MAG: 2Fe-2S iron-sulfur cluster-binding protein [Myxococcota bacterium]